jgi:hypothetical protein
LPVDPEALVREKRKPAKISPTRPHNRRGLDICIRLCSSCGGVAIED